MFKTQQIGSIDVFTINEPLRGTAVSTIESALLRLINEGQPHIVIDLEETSMIDSKGLELLMDLQNLAIQRGGAIRYCRPNNLVLEVLQLTGLDKSLCCYETTTQALGAFAESY